MLGPSIRVFFAAGVLGCAWKLRDYLALFLRQDSGEALFSALGRNLELLPLAGALVLSGLAGAVVLWGAAWARSRATGMELESTLSSLASVAVVLLVPTGVIAAAVASLALSPGFSDGSYGPYGVNLVVSLAMEGSFLALLTLGLVAAGLSRRASEGISELPSGWPRRLLGPAVVLPALALFTLATPARFYDEGVGQGNMFKYLRMASAAAGSGTLDIARADENPDVTFGEALAHVPRLAASYVRESVGLYGRFFGALSEGRIYRGEITASRANRSMFRSAEGGVYYINAPGPGLLLVPAYLVDRRLEAWLGWDKQIAVIVFWQLLGALLVYQIVLAASEIAGRTAAVLVAFAIGLAVPVLFYTFQIYPELPGGLALLFAFRKLVLDPAPSSSGVFAAGLALAAAPWLHQKYSVVAAVLGVYASYRLLKKTPGGVQHSPVKIVLLLAPMALSAYSIFLYNHALTGSLSPTATFRAAGRSSFEPWSFPKGFLGLLLDRENGLFVYAPLYVLALAGWSAFSTHHRRLVAPFLLVVGAYMLVIASFPYWPGAVSTMGRYILSILPLLALPIALVVRRALVDGAVAGVALVLAAASFAFSASFVRDLVPSYQPMMLWNRALYSEPTQYLASFLSEGALGSGPAHFPKVIAALLFIGTLVYLLRDRIRDDVRTHDLELGRYPRRLAVGAGAVLSLALALGALLERWPGNGPASLEPTYRDTLKLGSGARISVNGEHGFEGRGFWIPGGGASRVLLESAEPLGELDLFLTTGPEANRLVIRERGSAPMEIEVPPGGPHRRSVLVRKPYRFDGERGERFLYQLELRSEGSFVPADAGESDDSRSLGVYVGVR